MKYHCKYPNKLTMKGYFQKEFEEHKGSEQYSDLLDNEIKNLLWFVLLEIHVVMSDSKERLQQNIDLLLRIGNLSVEEYAAIPDDEREPNTSFDTLSLIIHNPADAVGLIANNMKVKFRSDKQNQYEMFLREITPNCIKKVTEVNQVKSTIKKVRFSEDIVSQSEDRSASSKKASQTSGLMDYQYAYHRSLNNGGKTGNETANNETSNLEDRRKRKRYAINEAV